MSRRQDRYGFLRAHFFLPLEARELSKLPKSTPAFRLMVQDRDARRARFERMAANKIAKGRWRRGDVDRKWLKNIARLYSRRGWRVKFGARGAQQKMPRFSPNPFSMYRAYERRAPGKDHVSPWEVKQLKQGKTLLQKGLIFVQQTEKKVREGGISKPMLRQWIDQKKEAVKGARGKRRVQLQIEQRRLEGLL